MKKILITGATGMIGGLILNHCLKSPEISQVTSFVRRKGKQKHPKLKEVILNDFSDYSNHIEEFLHVDVAYFCLGVYTGAVPDKQFKTITVDYTIAFSKAVKKNSPKVKFCFLSGAGADTEGKSRMSFAKYKGMAENHLMKQDFSQLSIFRPAYIYPVKKREEPNITYRISRALYPILKRVYSSGVITSEELANAIFYAGMNTVSKTTLENQEIKNLIS